MWDTVQDSGRDDHGRQLCHDLPCLRCGHAAHTYLACDDACGCQPAAMPGSAAAPTAAVTPPSPGPREPQGRSMTLTARRSSMAR